VKLLVAGGAGYIGSHLVPVLLEHGYEVDVVDLLWFGNHLPRGVTVIRKDLFDCGCEDLEGYDQVIFLAGLSNDPMAEFSPAMNFSYNAALPSYLAFTAKQAGVRRFVYASTCSVYGYAVDELYDEDGPLTCRAPYGISKLQGERGVLQLADEGFSTIALRQGTVCGYSPRMRLDLVVNTMFKSALAERTVHVSNPSIWRPILDIRDAATAYLRAVQAGDSLSGVYNVASGNFTVGQIGERVKGELERHLGGRVGIEIGDLEDFRNYKVAIDRARTSLGFSPKHDVEAIVEDLCEHRHELTDLEDDGYYNIRVFRRMFANRSEGRRAAGPDRNLRAVG